MKAIAALAIAATGAAIAACAPPAVHAARPTVTPLSTSATSVASGTSAANRLDGSTAQTLAQSIAQRIAAATTTDTDTGGTAIGAAVRFRIIQSAAVIDDAGSPDSYTAFVTVTEIITVQPTSAADVEIVSATPPSFTTPNGRAHWQAAGSPRLAPTVTRGPVELAPPGQFSFAPQGSTLTYQQARALPSTPQALTAQLRGDLQPYAGADPPSALILRQLGYLIANAPLTTATRAAAWRALAALPGLHLCGPGTDLAGRHGTGICADDGNDEVEVLVDTGTGAVLAEEDRILKQSPLYPTVPAGSLTEATAFAAL